MQFKLVKGSAEELCKQYFWLAWNACGGPLGMGWLQNKSGASIDDVWNNVINEGDYPGRTRNIAGNYYADYVFGRMMKVGIKVHDDVVEILGFPPRIDYQAWCHKYVDEETLLRAAADAAGCEVEVV